MLVPLFFHTNPSALQSHYTLSQGTYRAHFLCTERHVIVRFYTCTLTCEHIAQHASRALFSSEVALSHSAVIVLGHMSTIV